MSRPWYARRELELALLAMSTALAVFGVNAAVRLALDDVPAATPVSALPRAAAPEPLDAWAPIAARDLFNGDAAPRRATRSDDWSASGSRAARRARSSRTPDASPGARGRRRRGRRRARDVDRMGPRRARGRRRRGRARARDRAAGPRRGARAPARRGDAPPDGPRGQRAIRRTAPNAYVVDRRELAGALDDMSGLMTQLRAVAEVQRRPAGRLPPLPHAGRSIFAPPRAPDGDVVAARERQPRCTIPRRCSASSSGSRTSRASPSTSCAPSAADAASTTCDDARLWLRLLLSPPLACASRVAAPSDATVALNFQDVEIPVLAQLRERGDRAELHRRRARARAR